MDQITQFLITTVIAALVGLAVWFVQSRVEEIRRAEERIHDERRKIYAGILDPYIKILSTSDPKQSAKIVKYVGSYDYKKVAFELSLIGSDEVVKAFNKLMQFFYKLEGEGEGEANPKEMLDKWGGLRLEIRKSVGEPKTKLGSIDMLRGLIKDIDTVFEQENPGGNSS